MPLRHRHDSRGRHGFHWLADVGERFAASARDGLPAGQEAPRLLRKVAVSLSSYAGGAHGFSDRCPGLVRPAVARTATASRIPSAAVAVWGMVYGAPKPDPAACGADAALISKAAQVGQRRPARHPHAVQPLSAAATSPAATSPAAGAGCRAVAMARPHRLRSMAAVASSSAAISHRLARLPVTGAAGPVSALAGGRGPGRGAVPRPRPGPGLGGGGRRAPTGGASRAWPR